MEENKDGTMNKSFNKPTSTDGDNGNSRDVQRNLLEALLEKLSLNQGQFRFNKYTGLHDEQPEKFLDQFRIYKKNWTSEEYFMHIGNNLGGKAEKWFRGAKGCIFSTPDDFEVEFLCFFGHEDQSDNEKLLKKMSRFRLFEGNLENGLLEMFELQRESTINLKDMIAVITENLSPRIARTLKNERTWKGLLKVSKSLDEEVRAEREMKKKTMQNVPKEIKVRVSAEKQVPKHITCFKCSKNHYYTDCPLNPAKNPNETKQVNDTSDKKKYQLSIAERCDFEEKPMIEMIYGGSYIPALLDTGASHNFLNLSVVQNCKIKMEPLNEKLVLGKGSCNICGRTELNIKSKDGKYELVAEFFIVEDLNEKMILGRKALKSMNINITIGSKRIGIFEDYEIPLRKSMGVLKIKKMNETELNNDKVVNETELNNDKIVNETELNNDKIVNETELNNDKIVNETELNNDKILNEIELNNVKTVNEVTNSPRFGENEWLNRELKKIIEDTGVINASPENRILKIEKHEIELQEGHPQIYSRPYRRDVNENIIIREEIKKLLDKGLIRESNSRFASPVVLVRKKDDKIRFCVDYRKLNKFTVQKPYPIPHMDEALETISAGCVYTALDLESGYHQIEVAESDKEKTAFISKDGLFEWNVMPFGLINAPYTFQRIMNFVFKDFLYKFVIVYLDDILIFSKNANEHVKEVEIILKRISDCGFRLNMKKYVFGVNKIEFLGFEICNGKMKIKEDQKSKLMNFEIPKKVKDLRKILGFTAFYKRFIPQYTLKILPLLNRLKKGNFEFEEKEKESLKLIQNEINNAQELALPDISKAFIMYTDASDVGLGGVLCQERDGEGELPMLWISRKLTNAEINYTVTEKECLAIIWAIEKFKIYLCNGFIIKTDHNALTWLLNQKEPRGRIAHWIMKLQSFKFKIEHVKGTDNSIADALSRKFLNLCNMKMNEPSNFNLSTMETSLNEQMKEKTMRQAHEDLGHAGVESTYIFLKNKTYWNNLYQDVKEFIKSCNVCKKYADARKPKATLRLSLVEPFYRIGIDLVGPLPKTERGNKYIIVASDHLTRWAETRAVKVKSAYEVGKFIYDEIILRHGAPKYILSDQGKEFRNELITKLCERVKSIKSFTSAYNPQCNGSVERLNRTLIAKLAKICNGDYERWDEYLGMATFCYRIAPIGRLAKSPFELLYGRVPITIAEVDSETYEPGVLGGVESEEQLLNKIGILRSAIQKEAIIQRQNEMTTNNTNQGNEIKVGDVVMKKREPFEKLNKLDDKWSGPFIVKKDFGNGGFELEGIDGKRFRYNYRNLQLMEGSDSDAWEIDKEGWMLADDNKVLTFSHMLI